ncbi:hypothetical protein PCC7424_5427 (plasmid) [Gloeothece citriformis PCC 7424]|uniref:Uncharacterized protein n=1 Tax=Gloeothece citriformis (strain PCC 7424) TaxID=65393 RepID=B7KMI0_GLOC7|nr:hypothetical protein PCC7424_5427 [Gloeothece citriformis PCC 7424]
MIKNILKNLVIFELYSYFFLSLCILFGLFILSFKITLSLKYRILLILGLNLISAVLTYLYYRVKKI